MNWRPTLISNLMEMLSYKVEKSKVRVHQPFGGSGAVESISQSLFISGTVHKNTGKRRKQEKASLQTHTNTIE